MRHRACTAIALAALLCGCAQRRPAYVPEAITAKVVGAGAVAVPQEGTMSAPDTLRGSVSQVDEHWTPDFTAPPDAIEAKLGGSIGIEVLVEGAPFLTVIPLRTRVTHPPITDPRSGRTTTVDEWPSAMNAGFKRFAGWGFDDPWELVPGSWRMELLLGDRVLAAQDFQVTVAP